MFPHFPGHRCRHASSLQKYLPKTPLVRIPKISEALECDYYAKLENLQPTGAFKVRGGVNLLVMKLARD
jgi:threonine dehydratase